MHTDKSIIIVLIKIARDPLRSDSDCKCEKYSRIRHIKLESDMVFMH